MTKNHVPVLVQPVLDLLKVEPESWYVDATFGDGGHSQAILEKGGRVIGFDWDKEMIDRAKIKFESELDKGMLQLVCKNFTTLDEEVELKQKEKLVGPIAGIIFDLGTNIRQLTSSQRGFSFEGDGPLDMRMDQNLGVQAKHILAIVPEKQLVELFREEGGELHRYAQLIAKAIKKSSQPIETVNQLTDIIIQVKKEKKGTIHPATKVFQALRIAVNSELDNLREALPKAWNVLGEGGCIVVISFHEGEDRIVKQTFRKWANLGKGHLKTKKAVKADEDEVSTNPQARSARLRALQKIES